MCTVILGEDETFEKMYRRFRFMVHKEGIVETARRRQHFESKQKKRQRKHATSRRRQSRMR